MLIEKRYTMALTQYQKEIIQQKEDALPEGMRRNPNINYYEGWFFVTLNTRDEVPVLSICEGNPSIKDGEVGAPCCRYTKVGKGVIESWKKMSSVCNTVEVDLCEAMPDHFHGLVHLLPGNKRHLGSLISGFMSGCTHAYWDTLGIEWRKNRDEKVRTKQQGGKAAYAKLKPDRDKAHSHSLIGPALFVHGYNDMEPITPEEVEIKRAYIRDQARKRIVQGRCHACFVKHRHQHSSNWTVARCMDAIRTDRTFRNDSVRQEKAMESILSRLNFDSTDGTNASAMTSTIAPPSSKQVATSTIALTSGKLVATSTIALSSRKQAATSTITLPSGKQVVTPNIGLDYMGNKQLLWAGRKLPLICHSADAARFEQQKGAVLAAAREGAVIVSAFISPKERDIKNQLMIELLPFIEITDNGFSEKYKGVGKAFYAIAENRLLQITPWTYLYHKDGPQVSREMCLVMNELARVITGVDDGWWKK